MTFQLFGSRLFLCYVLLVTCLLRCHVLIMSLLEKEDGRGVMTNLVVPAFVWYGVPEHELSAVLCVPEKAMVVTGSHDGQVCIWHLATAPEAKARSTFNPTRHRSRVSTPLTHGVAFSEAHIISDQS